MDQENPQAESKTKEYTNLLYLFNLLVKTTYHVIGRIWNFFNLHEVDQRIHFARQDQVKNIAVVAKGNPC
jgi:predicted alpha/beta-fold hydrolase